MKIFLAVWHDRHTEDKYIAFYNQSAAIKQCRKWQKEAYSTNKYSFEETEYGKTWMLYCEDSYYFLVQEIDLLEKQ